MEETIFEFADYGEVQGIIDHYNESHKVKEIRYTIEGNFIVLEPLNKLSLEERVTALEQTTNEILLGGV